jgi:hypothetical protein
MHLGELRIYNGAAETTEPKIDMKSYKTDMHLTNVDDITKVSMHRVPIV